MPRKRVGLPITKPVSVWNRPLKANSKDLFKALSKTLAHGTTGNWEQAAIDATEALSAVGLEKDIGQLGWLLVQRALTRAIFDLVHDSADLLNPEAPELEGLCETIDLSFEETEITLDNNFFLYPAQFPLLKGLRTPLREWLLGVGLTEAQATTTLDRVPSYFVFALNDEWREHSKLYTPIKDALDTPFTEASEREQNWHRYFAWLMRQIDEPLFGETFSLRQIYVPLRAYYTERLRMIYTENLN